MRDLDGLILDMDGVLWRGDTPLPGLADLFAVLEAREIPFVLATNNATRLAEQYSEKLARFGVAVAPERILTSAEATARYLRRAHPEAETVYVVGEPALGRAMTALGLELVGPAQVRAGARAPVVVAALARDALTYDTLAMASLLIREGAHLVATNRDPTFPTELGPLPGAGAVVSFLETATDAEAIAIGKPEPALFEEAAARLGPGVRSPAMVGDRLQTDIAGGHAAGLTTILVLTGVSSRDDIERTGIRPDHVVADLSELTREIADR